MLNIHWTSNYLYLLNVLLLATPRLKFSYGSMGAPRRGERGRVGGGGLKYFLDGDRSFGFFPLFGSSTTEKLILIGAG